MIINFQNKFNKNKFYFKEPVGLGFIGTTKIGDGCFEIFGKHDKDGFKGVKIKFKTRDEKL